MGAFKKLFQTGFFHIFGSSVINKILTFLSNVVLVRLISKEAYGVFTYAWNIYSLVLLLNGLGVVSGLLQLCSERADDRAYYDDLCRFGARVGLYADGVLTVLLVLIGTLLPLSIPGGGRMIQTLCLLPPLQFIFEWMTIYLRGQRRNREYAALNTVNTLCVCVCSILGAVAAREYGLVWGKYLALLLTFVYAGCVLRFPLFRLLGRPGAIDRTDRVDLVKISLLSMATNGLSQLLYLSDVFVLGIVDPNETILASYKVATTIPTALTFIPSAIAVYLYPYFARHNREKQWCIQHYKATLAAVGGLNAIISGGLFLFAPLLIRILFGEIYLDAVPVFRVLAVSYFFSGTFRTIAGNLMTTQRKLRFNFIVSAVSGPANILSNWFFIQWWGSMGAAATTLLIVLLTGFANTFYLFRCFGRLED